MEGRFIKVDLSGKVVLVTGTAIFLASDSAAFINGEAISVNGGLRME